jgi:ABC-type amino acid transport system permease subunit
MVSALATPILGTMVLWALSAALSVTVASALAVGSLSRARALRAPADLLILLTRGVPTSLLVVLAGLAVVPFSAPGWLPNPFPGTSDGMALVGWAVTLALALGSTGHLAVIFRTGYRSLGRARLEQVMVLGMDAGRRFRLLVRESATASLAPTGARLVHHLHNTGFAALFPVVDLFGWVQQQSHETFQVSRYAAVGVAGYVLLSLLIWSATRAAEYRLGSARRGAVHRRARPALHLTEERA